MVNEKEIPSMILLLEQLPLQRVTQLAILHGAAATIHCCSNQQHILINDYFVLNFIAVV